MTKGQSKAGQASGTRVSAPRRLPDAALAEHHRQQLPDARGPCGERLAAGR